MYIDIATRVAGPVGEGGQGGHGVAVGGQAPRQVQGHPSLLGNLLEARLHLRGVALSG